jgi:hypothetical protein
MTLGRRWGWLFVWPVLIGGRALSQAPARHFFDAAVFQVEKSHPTLPYRRRIADSPPPPTEFDFKVTFRMDCTLYDALYESATDYLPGTIAAGKQVGISVEKHVIYVRAPGGREIRMETLRRYKADRTCGVAGGK